MDGVPNRNRHEDEEQMPAGREEDRKWSGSSLLGFVLVDVLRVRVVVVVLRNFVFGSAIAVVVFMVSLFCGVLGRKRRACKQHTE